MNAEKEGFDAVIIGCYLDPGLQAAKQLLNIPVLGIAESSMHFSSMACSKFAIITSDKHYIQGMEELVERYNVERSVIYKSPVRAVSFTSEEYEKHLFSGNHKPIIEEFQMIAKACIDDGAELIIAGCAVLALAITPALAYRVIVDTYYPDRDFGICVIQTDVNEFWYFRYMDNPHQGTAGQFDRGVDRILGQAKFRR